MFRPLRRAGPVMAGQVRLVHSSELTIFALARESFGATLRDDLDWAAAGHTWRVAERGGWLAWVCSCHAPDCTTRVRQNRQGC